MLDIDVEENIEAVIVAEVDDVLSVCVWARATGPDVNDKRRARKAIVMRMQILILLPKPATFTPDRMFHPYSKLYQK